MKRRFDGPSGLDIAFNATVGDCPTKAVLIVMGRRGNVSLECFMSFNRIAEEAECNIKTVRNSVEKLLMQGWIEELQPKLIAGKRLRCFRLVPPQAVYKFH